MKAGLLALAVVLVLLHPAAAVAVLAVELGACTALGCLIMRGLRPLCFPAPRRRTT